MRNFGTFFAVQKTFLLKFLICNGYRTESLKDAGHLDAEGTFTSGSCSRLQQAKIPGSLRMRLHSWGGR